MTQTTPPPDLETAARALLEVAHYNQTRGIYEVPWVAMDIFADAIDSEAALAAPSPSPEVGTGWGRRA